MQKAPIITEFEGAQQSLLRRGPSLQDQNFKQTTGLWIIAFQGFQHFAVLSFIDIMTLLLRKALFSPFLADIGCY